MFCVSEFLHHKKANGGMCAALWGGGGGVGRVRDLVGIWVGGRRPGRGVGGRGGRGGHNGCRIMFRGARVHAWDGKGASVGWWGDGASRSESG